MAKDMQKKFDKYWGSFANFNPLMVIAVVLDPRYKMKFLKYAFEQMYPNDPESRIALLDKVKKMSFIGYLITIHLMPQG